YVLDPEYGLAPIGVPGEICVGGDGVARGYLGRPSLTAERFVPDPFAARPGARMYRTGDRARWKSDATLEYLGRLDAQVKIRGFRIEPGEIEAALRRHPDVRECVVIPRSDAFGGRVLVAYVVGDVDGEALRTQLRASLPEHMVPSAFVGMDAIPLTPNGKVDRAALPAPDASDAGEAYVAPRDAAEAQVAAIFAEVLDLERVGIHDNFFAMGGHSLLATRVVSRARAAFRAELPLRALFERPTVAGLAEQLRSLPVLDESAVPDLVPLSRGGLPASTAGLSVEEKRRLLAEKLQKKVRARDRFPLSFAQQRLWFIDQLQPGSAAYNIPVGYRVRGDLDPALLERALGLVVRRHESLRTVFPSQGGEPVQVVLDAMPVPVPVIDLGAHPAEGREAELRRLASQEVVRPFDLAQGPLLRATVVRLDDADWAILFTMHHVVSDGWSMQVLVDEVSALYGALQAGREPALPPLPLQYADYAVWQRGWLKGEVVDAQLAWWRGQLAGAPPLLELPTDFPRPRTPDPRGGHATVAIPGETVRALRAVAHGEGATLFMALLAAWQAVLGRHAGTDDVSVGTPVAGRTRAELEGLIGFFVNTLVMRTDLSGAPSFRALLRRVRETALGAFARQDVPLDRLVEELAPERSLGHTPLFQVLFSLLNDGSGDLHLGSLQAELIAGVAGAVKFDLTLTVAEWDGGLRGSIAYRAELFERATAERMVEHLRALLEGIAADPDRPVAGIPLLRDDERRALLEMGRAPDADHPAGAVVHRRFEAHAARHPGAPAVVCGADALTAAELNARANRIAHRLRRMGVGPDVPVALCLERGVDSIAALLGVLKAGGAYVALDPALPAERLRYMLADSRAAALVTRGGAADGLPADGIAVLHVDDASLADEPAEDGDGGVRPEHLAYVIYTSGSTGRPKGVAVEHRQLSAYLAGVRERLGWEDGWSCATVSTLSADLGHTSVFSALAWGGCLH
ncbi:MAG TPA: condensation domain-containing protein, partial [Longimicrobium sp.]